MLKIISQEINYDNPKLIDEYFTNIKIMISVWPEETMQIVIDLS